MRGTKGTFLKYGVDVQEDQLKVLANPAEITTSQTYGMEPEAIWGTVDNFGEGGQVVRSP